MKIVFSPTALEHLEYWRKTSPATVAKIKAILSDISEHPFSGIAKPEPLKGPLKGLWSRRINQEHRLIYKVEGQEIQVLVLSRFPMNLISSPATCDGSALASISASRIL